MTPVTDISRAYRPLNGEDVIKAILLEIRTALVNSGMFPLHRVWHEFEFQGGVRVKGWATKTEEVKFAGGDEIGEAAPAEGLELVDRKVAMSLRDEPPSVTRERIADDALHLSVTVNDPSKIADLDDNDDFKQTLHEATPADLQVKVIDSSPIFACAKCGRPSRTKAGKSAHERHCKVELNVPSEPLSTPA